MTELQNLKIDLFALVERINVLSTKNEGTFSFTKEQLLSYSKFLINEAMDNIKTGIENDLDEDCIDEAVEIELSHNNRELTVNIDIRAVRYSVRSLIEESVANEDIEDSVICALGHIGYTFEDRPLSKI